MFICKGLGSQMVGVKQKLELAEDERKRRRRRGGLEQGQSKCLKEVESSLANRNARFVGQGQTFSSSHASHAWQKQLSKMA